MSEQSKQLSEIINKLFPAKIQKKNWVCRTIFKSSVTKIGEEYDEDKIKEQLDKQLVEIKAFEARLKEKLALEGY